MIKTKCNLDINIIKPLTKLGNCNSNCYYLDSSNTFCNLYGSYLSDMLINICKNFSERALNIIEYRIRTRDNFCEDSCHYVYFDLYYKLYKCDLFNKSVGSMRTRCKQCIDLYKGCYL